MSFKHVVVMPKMSMTMETGDLIAYHVAVGQTVKAGDLLFEVMTDKIDMEVDSPADGTITALVGAVGATIEIGKPVLEMETQTQVLSFDFADDPAPAEPVAPAPVATPVVTPPPAPVSPVPPVIAPPVAAPQAAPQVTVATPPAPTHTAVVVNEKVRAVPAARALALEKGIDIRTVMPTGPDETIMYADVAGAQSSPELLKRRAANQALVAKGIAEGSLIPQVSVSQVVNLNAPSLSSIMSSWSKLLKEALNTEIGVALVTESVYGSSLPVYKGIDAMDPIALNALIESTTQSARAGKVPFAMLSGATTTLFDIRKYNLSGGTLGLLPGQSSTLVIGAVGSDKVELTLTLDLRVFDLYDGAKLLSRLITML
jgi:pyruvate dehydrogenase E2 component (dihydrolipoamide acetyltransferase)